MRAQISSILRRFDRFIARERSGLSGIEFALIAPVLILMAIAAADLALAVYTRMEVEEAAQAGAQYAALHGYNSSSMSSAVTNATTLPVNASPSPSQFCGCPSSSGVTTATCGTTCASGVAAGTYVSASASYTYSTILSYPGVPTSFTFSSTSTMRTQ